MDISALLALAKAAGRLISAAYDAQTGSVFSVVGLIGPYRELHSVDVGAAIADLKLLDDTALAQVEAAFNASLSLPAALDAKVKQAEGYLNRAFDLLHKAMPIAKQAYDLEQQAVALLTEVETFLGV